MDAYTLVDLPVRRKMEELLWTWKETPPTGIFSGPVFPHEATRRIENALLKAKTVALQLEQRRQREMAASGLAQHRNTPPLYQSPHLLQQGWSPVRDTSNFIQLCSYSLQNIVNTSHPMIGSTGSSNQDVLLAEINNLLTTINQSLMFNPGPGDEAARTQANALTQLQTILQTSQLPFEQVELVRQQLAALPIANRQLQTATPPLAGHEVQPTASTESLFQSLEAAGLLQIANRSTDTPPPSQISTIQPLAVNGNTVNLRTPDLELSSSSLQKYILLFRSAIICRSRPYLIDLLYNPKDLQCRTCARRFPNTSQGQAKRDAHLDWHFRINKRLRENVGRVQTRTWYLTEEVLS